MELMSEEVENIEKLNKRQSLLKDQALSLSK